MADTNLPTFTRCINRGLVSACNRTNRIGVGFADEREPLIIRLHPDYQPGDMENIRDALLNWLDSHLVATGGYDREYDAVGGSEPNPVSLPATGV